MNKQEFMNYLKRESRASANAFIDSNNLVFQGEARAYQNASLLCENLDEPQKVKVPQFVAEWIETAKKEKRTLHYSMQDIDDACYYHKGDDPLYQWMFVCGDSSEHQEMFARAYTDGYEIEEEPKYYVNIGYLYLKEPLGDTSDFTISMTWNREYAYPFDSWNMAREHASKLGGTAEKV